MAALLENYKPLEWPDLTAARIPGREAHTTSLPTCAPVSPSDLIIAVTRAIGVYTGSSDILVAAQADTPGAVLAVRVQWSEETTWEQLSECVQAQLTTPQLATLDELRRELEFGSTQMPCMALFAPVAPPNDDYPLVVSQRADEVVLASHEHHIHPSVAAMLSSQVLAIHQRAMQFRSSLVSALGMLPSALLSIWERRSLAECATEYDHFQFPVIATDLLTMQVRKAPDTIFLNWIPDIGQDSVAAQLAPGQILTAGYLTHTLTFLQLHQRANQVARWLLSKGLQREDRVAVCIQRDLNFHVALFGIIRAGGCYVPIDAELNEERKRYIAADSGARFVLTARDVASPQLFGAATVFMDDAALRASIAALPVLDLGDCEGEDVSLLATPDSLAFMLYTSGTTGNPKGCLLTNRGLSGAIWGLSQAASRARMPDICKGRYLAVASIAFDVHIAETFTPIALGMQLFSAPRSLLFENLPSYIKRLRITHVGIVPSLIEATMGAVADEGDDMSLRFIASGGEKMSDAILEKWANHPQVRLANFYGPSEVTIGCCYRFVDSNTPKANIGTALHNVGGYVVDGQLNVVPRGGVGELVVEGPLVGRGYHERPDLTAKVFLEWPRKGLWAYRTGDLVRMMPDSTLEILGRIDTQIKLRGVRIESEGISNIIRKAAPVSLGAALDVTTVLAKHPEIGMEQLVAFVAWNSSISIATRKASKPTLVNPPSGLFDVLRLACEKGLASYMRPSHLIPLSWLALSSNGKVDAKVMIAVFNALPISSLTSLMSDSTEHSASTRSLTNTEAQVVRILRAHTTMSLDFAHPSTNLFECGLDSLAIIRFAADLRASFGARTAVSDIMVAPTVEGVASALEAALATSTPSTSNSFLSSFADTWTTLVMKEYLSVERILPPFPVQQGVLYRSAEEPTLYVQHVVLQLRAKISTAALRSAWEAVAAGNIMLRTVFYFGKALVQVVLPVGTCELPWTENSAPDSMPFTEWFQSHQAATLSTEINHSISTTPAFRLNVFTHGDSNYFVISIHHALYDGIALPALLRAVEVEYLSIPAGPHPDLPAILEHLASVDTKKAQKFWRDQFETYQWPTVPLRLSSSTVAHHAKHSFATSLSSMKSLAASQHITLQALLTYAFAKLLATRMYGKNDVVFGVIRSGRMLPTEDVDAAICPLISVLPARVDFSQGKTTDVLQHIQRNIAAAVELEHVPLGKVQTWVRSGADMFETLFSMSVKDNGRSELWDPVESRPPNPDYMLAVEVAIDPETDTLVVQAAYTVADLSKEFVESFVGQFEATVTATGSGLEAPALSLNSVAHSLKVLDLPGESEPNRTVDPALLLSLRSIVAGFLTIQPGILKDGVSFVSLGLDSIQTISLSRLLRSQGHNVSAVQLMKHSTVHQLGQLLTAAPLNDATVTDASFESVLREIRTSMGVENISFSSEDEVAMFPTTVLQAGMLSQTLASQGELYVHAFPLILDTNVDVQRLQKAWSFAVETFAILRTTFHFAADLGVWTQAVHSQARLDWSEGSYVSNVGESLHEFISSVQFREEHDFHRPPIRLRVLHGNASSNEPSRLVIVMHHALYDGLAVAKLLEAVDAIYRKQEIGTVIQFTDLLGHFASQERLGTSFWADHLRDYIPKPLRKCASDGPTSTSHIVSHEIHIDSTATESVCRLAAVTPQCLGQAAWAKALSSIVGGRDVVFGHIVSGRSIPGAEDVVGPLLNTIPCRVVLSDGQSNTQLLQKIHHANVAALSWQQASLRAIQRELGLSNLWDSLFSFQPLDTTKPEQPPLWRFDGSGNEDVKTQYPFNVELYQTSTGFKVQAASNSDFLTLEAFASFIHRFEDLLRTIILRPEASAIVDVKDMTGPLTPATAIPLPVTPSLPTNAAKPVSYVLRDILAAATKLPVEHIKPDTHLAALGIDSITAVQIVAKCRRAGLRVTAAAVIASRTVSDLAQFTTENFKPQPPAFPAPQPASLVSIPSDEATDILAQVSKSTLVESVWIVTPGMKWLVAGWTASQGTRFQHCFAFRLAKDVDHGNLQYAWTALVRRHAILRSTFAASAHGREPRLVTFKVNGHVDWREEQLEEEGEGYDEVYAHMKSLLETPPPLGRPQTQALLLRHPQKSFLVIRLHHFQYDAWSLRLLMDDLSSFYKGVDPSSSNDLRSLLQEIAPSMWRLQEQEAYWTSAFPKSFMPVLFPSLTETPHSQSRTILVVKDALMDAKAYETKALELGISLQALFLSCWAKVQASVTSSNGATFGIWHAGRGSGIEDIERMAVPCMNVLPIYVANEGDVAAMAIRIQEDLRRRTGVAEQSDLADVDTWVGGGGKPLCNVFVNVVKVAPDVEDFGEVLLEPIFTPHYTPIKVNTPTSLPLESLPVSALVKDDVMVDFATLESKNTILMSVEAAAHVVSVTGAEILVEKWTTEMKLACGFH